MNILVTGASGLIGSALTTFLATHGHRVVSLVRTKSSSHSESPTWNPEVGQVNLTPAGPLDAVVHLAGQTIGTRWTARVKRRIRESRIEGTRLLSEALARMPKPPEVMICASAVGFYGDRGDEWLDEQSGPGHGFLAGLCREWEAAVTPAIARGIRVAHLRFGIILSSHGGALARMLPAFKSGFGGTLGGGSQYWSWIAIDDALGAIHHALVMNGLLGPVNAVAPNPPTNREFTKTLGHILHRPTIFSVPRFAVELLFGEMGREALLSSCRVKPARLVATGFQFRHPELQSAIRELLKR